MDKHSGPSWQIEVPQQEVAALYQQRLLANQPECAFASYAARMSPLFGISGDIAFVWRAGTEKDPTFRGFIGDAMGKGVEAAFVSLIALAGMTATGRSDCAERLKKAHNLIYTEQGLTFMTGLHFSLRPDGRLSLANAGHLPALLLHANGSIDFVPKSAGHAMGMFEGALDCETESYQLVKGDRLLLLTDGLVENRALSLSHDTLEHIARAGWTGSLSEDADTIWTMLQALNPSAAQDDQTMMLVEYSG